MKSIFYIFYLIIFLTTNGFAQDVSCDCIRKGFATNIQGKARMEWFDSLYARRHTLTNTVLRSKVATEMINILQSKQSSNQDKCAAAHIIGLFSIEQGVGALVENLMLYNEELTGLDEIYLREGRYPAQCALVDIGELSIPEVVEYLESSTNSFSVKCGAKVVLFIKGQEDGITSLKQAIADQTDSKKKDNLKAALSSEYFTDPKYRASGPKKK